MSQGIEEVIIPTCWNGLSKEQLIAYAQLMYPYRKKLISVKDDQLFIKDEEQFNTICFGLLYYFLGLDFETYHKIPAEEIHRLLHHEKILHFLWETYDLDINLVPTIETAAGIICGPTDFGHISFEEMQIAEGHFIAFVNEGSFEELDKFISCLYRESDPTKKYGDLRIPFEEDLVSYQLPGIKCVPAEHKVAALIWYESQRDVLIENFDECFGERGSGQPQTLAQMMLSIGQGLEKFDLVRKSPAVLVYTDIQRVIIQNKKLIADGNRNN